jgi:putative hydrolase of the HAD superfamily
MPIKVLVFDLGKVIFDFDLFKFTKLFSKKTPCHPDTINKLLTEYTDFAIEYEKGNITPRDFFETIKEKTHYSASFDEFCILWNNIFVPIEQSIELIAKAAANYPVGILSNTNELHWEYLKERYRSFFMIFYKIHVSHELRMRKPDDEIFQAVIKDYGVKPEEIFFTDDMAENTAAAERNGIVARRFQGAGRLKRQMEELKIKL